MCQLDVSRYIPNGIDSREGRLIVFIHGNKPTVHCNGNVRGKEPLRVGPPANGAEDSLPGGGLLPALSVEADPHASLRFLQAGDIRSGVHSNSPLFKNHAEVLSQLPIQRRQQAVHSLNHCHLTAKIRVKRGKLHPDHTSADHDQRLVKPPVLQQVIGGHDLRQVQPWNRRASGHRPCCQQDVSGS